MPLYYHELQNKINAHLNSRYLAGTARSAWTEIKTHLDSLSENASQVKYLALGIYDRGDVVLPGSYDECFLDITSDLAFIRDLYGSPYEADFGLKIWPRNQADFDILPINGLKAWQLCHAHGWLDWQRDPDDNPLRFALSHAQIDNPEIYDFLYNKFPDTGLKDMFWNVKCVSAAKWLCQEPHTADKYYKGLRMTMREAVASRGYRQTPEIMSLLYGDDNKEDES